MRATGPLFRARPRHQPPGSATGCPASGEPPRRYGGRSDEVDVEVAGGGRRPRRSLRGRSLRGRAPVGGGRDGRGRCRGGGQAARRARSLSLKTAREKDRVSFLNGYIGVSTFGAALTSNV